MVDLDYDFSYNYPPKETQRIKIMLGPAREYVFISMIPVFGAVPFALKEAMDTNW